VLQTALRFICICEIFTARTLGTLTSPKVPFWSVNLHFVLKVTCKPKYLKLGAAESTRFINHVESAGIWFGTLLAQLPLVLLLNVFILPPLVGFDLCAQFALYKTRIYAVGS